ADPPGGRGGWGLGKPDRTVWPTARLSVAGTPVPTYYDGFPKAPPTPPALSAVLEVGSRTRVATRWLEVGRDRRSSHDSPSRSASRPLTANVPNVSYSWSSAFLILTKASNPAPRTEAPTSVTQ